MCCLLGILSFTLGGAKPIRVLAESEDPPRRKIFFPQVGQSSYFLASISPDWMIQVNHYRSMADLPPLMENLEWSEGDRLHARYMVKNDQVMHTEEAGNAWYTVQGHTAAESSNLVGSGNANASDLFAIDAWMQAPFHAVGVLDPELTQIGYGSYREQDGVVQMGAALDVLRGLGDIPASVRFPIIWPSSGAVVPLTSFSSEHPNPLTSCPGYASPSGLPIIVQLGPGHLAPQVSASSFSTGSNQLEHCVFSEVNYNNPNSSEQELGRSILAERDAVILIPRQPLSPGSSYTVSIAVDGQTYTWTFEVSAEARTLSEASE
jgi:hypothetical protein